MDADKSAASLEAILEHSLFHSEAELLAELDAIIGGKGTRIIIWNLRREKNEQTEFDFDTDKYDIRIPAELDQATGKAGYKKQERQDQVVPESDYSLRAYCSILYLKPRMQIIIRGQKVQTQLVSKSLAHIVSDVYRPKFLAPKTVKITFGFNCRNKDHYGMMMYHKNRLIKAYERVGFQLKANDMGLGVIGIIECNFLKPTHNKQDFDYTKEYRLTIHALGEKLNDYWNEMQAKKKEYPLEVLTEETQKRPDQTWVQCDSCLKWRKLPDGITQLPDKWYCSFNPDPQFRNCNVPEEPEDDDLIPYEKTYKKKDRENLKKRLELSQQACSAFTSTPPTISESVSRLHTDVSNTFHSKCLNTTNNTSVSSPLPAPENSLKRRLSRPESPLPFKITRVTSQAFENKKDDDDDVIILEDSSTPKPPATECDITIVKVEGSVDQSAEERESPKNKDAKQNSEAKCSKGTAATQTEVEQLVVKKEEVQDNVDDSLPRLEPESEMTLSELVPDSEAVSVDVGIGVNELKIQLQSANEEREKYQSRCDKLFQEINMLKQKIREMDDKYVKKEMCHKSTETDIIAVEELEKVRERRPEEVVILYEQALKEMRQLQEKCNRLEILKFECCKCNNFESKNEVDDMAVQLDDVFRKLDRCTIERDQYKSEIELLEMEKTQLGFQCEELKTEVAQLKASIPQMVTNENSAVAEDSVNYSHGESVKLRSLRINVGQLLATLMPDLDLQQVNYDVDVVDVLLGQIVEHMHEVNSA
ncbi:MORC family CW-type zinc finger protein 3 isoform X1 [Tiliqua scincoides]|uniref:MORC family CW-type zinc finger protein 3 isoform X1 n=1 Tax=Tiliqua scincoides TaxID=71010 RepID=UPI0034637899